VANRVFTRRATIASATAHAIEIPSKVEVPRPISSRTTRLRDVISCRIAAVSDISTMNVDWPAARLSLAPMRVKMRSTSGIRADAAGTKQPQWASSTISAVWRRNVDLPAMLGPVITISRRLSSPRRQSLATNESLWRASTTGCRPATISSSLPLWNSGLT